MKLHERLLIDELIPPRSEDGHHARSARAAVPSVRNARHTGVRRSPQTSGRSAGFRKDPATVRTGCPQR